MHQQRAAHQTRQWAFATIFCSKVKFSLLQHFSCHVCMEILWQTLWKFNLNTNRELKLHIMCLSWINKNTISSPRIKQKERTKSLIECAGYKKFRSASTHEDFFLVCVLRRPAYFGFSPHLAGKHLRGGGCRKHGGALRDSPKLVVPTAEQQKLFYCSESISCARTHDSFIAREWNPAHCVRVYAGPLFTSLSELWQQGRAGVSEWFSQRDEGWQKRHIMHDGGACTLTVRWPAASEYFQMWCMRVTWCKSRERFDAGKKRFLKYKSWLLDIKRNSQTWVFSRTNNNLKMALILDDDQNAFDQLKVTRCIFCTGASALRSCLSDLFQGAEN